MLDAHSRARRRPDLGLALEGGRLLADLLLLVQLGDADRLLALGLAGADRLSLSALATWTAFSRSASATRISPIFSLSATSPRAFWMASEAAFWPMASM